MPHLLEEPLEQPAVLAPGGLLDPRADVDAEGAAGGGLPRIAGADPPRHEHPPRGGDRRHLAVSPGAPGAAVEAPLAPVENVARVEEQGPDLAVRRQGLLAGMGSG